MTDEMAGGPGRHPIRVVAQRTGLSLHVLRAWERRYGVVEPERGAGGQRLYTDADIERLKLMREATEAGRSISQVAALSDGELAALVAGDRTGSLRGPVVEPRGAGAEAIVQACLEAAERLDVEALHRILLRAVVTLKPREFIGGLVGPLLVETGDRWHRRELMVSQEHAVSVAVRRVLTFLLSAYEVSPRAPTLVTTTISGEQHEFGAMLASVLAAEAGWRVLYLGPSLPADEVAYSAKISRASAVGISVVADRESTALTEEVALLRAMLPAQVRLLVGGGCAEGNASVLCRIGGVECGGLELVTQGLPRVPLEGPPV